MAGKFTVNLGVFVEGDSAGVGADRAKEHDCRCDRRTRIGAVVPVRFPSLARLPLVGLLFGAQDRWWHFSDDPTPTHEAVSAAVGKIAAHGFAWLDARGA